MSNDNTTALKKYLPLIISSSSLAISCYLLYQSLNIENVPPPQEQSTFFLSRRYRYKDTSAKYVKPILEEKEKAKHLASHYTTNTLNQNDNNHCTATLSRIMLPDDANSSGNVHGGTILKMIGHVSWLTATRYINKNINKNNNYQYRAVLVRMEEMNFKLAMYIGEICICSAKTTFTSSKSIEVQVNVTAENAQTGVKRITNSARMWFVGLKIPINIIKYEFRKENVIKIPQLFSNDLNGKQRYLSQKSTRNQHESFSILNLVDLNEFNDRLLCVNDFDLNRSSSTVFKLTQVTLPSDCFGNQTRIIDGGYVMKLMDNVAGCVACGWTKTRCVTIHIASINFLSPINAGNVCHCYGRLIFTSNKSMEVYVLTFVHVNNDDIDDNKSVYKMFGSRKLKLVCSAFFTFVALNNDNPPKTIVIPKYIPYTDFEKMMFNNANIRYNARKAKAKAASKYLPTVIVGPSGVGKGTLIRKLKEYYPLQFNVAVSHTTRKARNNEIDGVHYHFITKNEFENGIKCNTFIEYAQIYGNLYGTSKKSLKKCCDNHEICLLEIDYIGAKQIKNSSISANYLFITCANEINTLKERLKKRNTENIKEIEKRIKTAKIEFEFYHQNESFFDHVITNDDITDSTNKMITLFKNWYPWLTH